MSEKPEVNQYQDEMNDITSHFADNDPATWKVFQSKRCTATFFGAGPFTSLAKRAYEVQLQRAARARFEDRTSDEAFTLLVQFYAAIYRIAGFSEEEALAKAQDLADQDGGGNSGCINRMF